MSATSARLQMVPLYPWPGRGLTTLVRRLRYHWIIAPRRRQVLRMRLAYLLLIALLVGCAHSSLGSRRDEFPLLLHVVHSSGGDAPLVSDLSIFGSGQVRYQPGGRQPRWARLSASELEEFTEALRAPRLAAALSDLPRNAACCDSEWVALEREWSAGTVAAIKNPPTLNLPIEQIDLALRQTLLLVRGIAERHFHRRFPDSRALWSVAQPVAAAHAPKAERR